MYGIPYLHLIRIQTGFAPIVYVPCPTIKPNMNGSISGKALSQSVDSKEFGSGVFRHLSMISDCGNLSIIMYLRQSINIEVTTY